MLIGVALRSALLPKTESPIAVDRHAKTVDVHDAQVRLRVQKAHLLCPREKAEGLAYIRIQKTGHALFEEIAEHIHGIGVIECGGGAQQFDGLRLVFRNSLGVKQAVSEGDHGISVSPGSSLLKPCDSGGKVGRLISEAIGHHQTGLGHCLRLSLRRGSRKPFQGCLGIALSQPFAQQHLRG